MRTREEHIKPWGYISPFAKKCLQYSERCNLTITRKSTVSETMALYTDDQLREAERRAEQRVRAEIGRDSERLDWLEKTSVNVEDLNIHCLMNTAGETSFGICGTGNYEETLRQAIDAAREGE